MSRFSKTLIAVCIAVLAFSTVLTGGINIGLYLAGKTRSATAIVTPDNNTDTYETRYSRLDEVYTRLMEQYYREVDSETLILGAIDGMMASLDDPYTFYYTPEDMTVANEKHEGNYVGIGIQVTYVSSGDIVITRVFKDGPADEAGILVGDIICAANGYDLKATTSQELTECVNRIKSEDGSFTQITILRNGRKIDFSVECRGVVNTRVEYRMLDEKVGYIVLYEFFGNAVSAMEEALAFMQENHAESVILDLRNNTGGQLDICLEICNMFLPEGVVVYTENRNGDREYYYSDGEYYDIPMAVLVNKLTASASEIFTAAVQDYERATVVGQTTFGKGIVQTWYQFPVDGAGMQFTTSAYYTPLGRSIHKTGITPDVYVEEQAQSEESVLEGMTLDNDSVLRKASEILTGSENEQ